MTRPITALGSRRLGSFTSRAAVWYTGGMVTREKSVVDPKRLLEIAERVPNCGCGDPDAMWRFVRQVLRWANSSEVLGDYIKRIIPNHEGAYWFMLHAFDKAGLIEHGTSARTSFPTEDGLVLLAALYEAEGDLGDWFDMTFDRVHNPHLFDADGRWQNPLG